MANSPQSRKRARQGPGRRRRNVMLVTRFRTYLKKARAAAGAGDAAAAREAFAGFVRIADSSVGKGIVHRNKVARLKRALSLSVKRLSAASADGGASA